MEYQYYEFQTIDRRLTKAEQEEIKKLSSRVVLTAHRAVFTYSYGDFRGDPLTVLQKYFDALLYMANWGSYQLAFRFPKSLLNPKALEPYCDQESVEVSTVGSYVILNIELNDEEGGGWIEEDNGWLNSLLPLRQAILRGDYRVLYLAWLKEMAIASEAGYLETDPVEPPVPPNLQTLDSALQSFAEWLNLDPDLVSAAGQTSLPQEIPPEPFQEWIEALSESAKNDLLLELITNESTSSTQLQARLRQKFAQPSPDSSTTVRGDRRRFSQLQTLATQIRSNREAQEQAEAKAKRQKYLKSLKPREAQLWDTIHELIARKQAIPYDQAVQHLIDLRDLAQLEGNTTLFQSRLRQIENDYANRPGLLRRMQEAKLI